MSPPRESHDFSRWEEVKEYVVRHIVDAAEADLADRRVFVVDDAVWVELQTMLDRPVTQRPRLEKLLNTPLGL